MKLSLQFTRQNGMYLIPTIYFVQTWTTRWLVCIAWLDFRAELHFMKEM